MAANSSRRGLATFGKRFVSQIYIGVSADVITPASSLFIRRGLNVSVYDKNVEEQVRPSLVPDDIIHPSSDKYWGPNPSTGVFGPGTEKNPADKGARANASSAESVLEQKAFFRPLEGLEKPEVHP